VKILAKFLLVGVFVLLAGAVPVRAQDCGHGIMWNHDEQSVIEDLEQRQDCLSKKLEDSDPSYLKNEIDELQDKLQQAELDRHTAEIKSADLKASLGLIEIRLAHTEDEIEWLARKAPASKPKARVSKPTAGFIPDIPATTPHAASKKPDASKPKTPLHKPTPAVKEGTH